MAYSSTQRAADAEAVEAKLNVLAKELADDLAVLDAAKGKELLGDFVSELFLSLARQSQQEDRRQKQAEGIAAAKARGVRFGRTARPVPDNFEETYQAWVNGEISLKKAAESCNMARATFQNIATRREQQAEGRAV